MGYIDLHVHSNISDGKLTVTEIMEKAKATNVTAIAFAEHYNMGSYNIAKKLSKDLIEVIPAVEISASLEEFGLSKKHICHIVAYYPSYTICKILDYYEMTREDCVKRTLKKLQQSIPISYSEVKKYARDKNSVGRFDIAIALYRKGIAKSPVDAYGQFLELGKAGYVIREKLPVAILIEKIRNCNGVPVLVHPKSLRLSLENTFNLLKKLKEYGLEGIEAFNPCHTEIQTQEFLLLANYFNFITTCGSDYHAMKERGVELATGINNNLCIDDYSIITKLKERQHSIYKNG